MMCTRGGGCSAVPLDKHQLAPQRRQGSEIPVGVAMSGEILFDMFLSSCAWVISFNTAFKSKDKYDGEQTAKCGRAECKPKWRKWP